MSILDALAIVYCVVALVIYATGPLWNNTETAGDRFIAGPTALFAAVMWPLLLAFFAVLLPFWLLENLPFWLYSAFRALKSPKAPII